VTIRIKIGKEVIIVEENGKSKTFPVSK
jgi:hypothetical protein